MKNKIMNASKNRTMGIICGLLFSISALFQIGCGTTSKLPVATLYDEIGTCEKIKNKYGAVSPSDTAMDVKKYVQLLLKVTAIKKTHENKLWIKRILAEGRIEDLKALNKKIKK